MPKINTPYARPTPTQPEIVHATTNTSFHKDKTVTATNTQLYVEPQQNNTTQVSNSLFNKTVELLSLETFEKNVKIRVNLLLNEIISNNSIIELLTMGMMPYKQESFMGLKTVDRSTRKWSNNDLITFRKKLFILNNILETKLNLYNLIIDVTKKSNLYNQNFFAYTVKLEAFNDIDIIKYFLHIKEIYRELCSDLSIESENDRMPPADKLACIEECKKSENLLLSWRIKITATCSSNFFYSKCKEYFSTFKVTHFDQIIQFLNNSETTDGMAEALDILMLSLINEQLLEKNIDYDTTYLVLIEHLLEEKNKTIVKESLDKVFKQNLTKIATNYKLSILLSMTYITTGYPQIGLEILEQYKKNLLNNLDTDNPDKIYSENSDFLNNLIASIDMLGVATIIHFTKGTVGSEQEDISPEKRIILEHGLELYQKYYTTFNDIIGYISLKRSTSYMKLYLRSIKDSNKEIVKNIIPAKYNTFCTVRKYTIIKYTHALINLHYQLQEIKQQTKQNGKVETLEINKPEVPEKFLEKQFFCTAILNLNKYKSCSFSQLTGIIDNLNHDMNELTTYINIFAEHDTPSTASPLEKIKAAFEIIAYKQDKIINKNKEKQFNKMLAEETQKSIALQAKTALPLVTASKNTTEEKTKIKKTACSTSLETVTSMAKPAISAYDEIINNYKNDISANKKDTFNKLKILYEDASLDDKINICYSIMDFSCIRIINLTDNLLTDKDNACISELKIAIANNSYISKTSKEYFHNFLCVFVENIWHIHMLHENIKKYLSNYREVITKQPEASPITATSFHKLMKDIEKIQGEFFLEAKQKVDETYYVNSMIRQQIIQRIKDRPTDIKHESFSNGEQTTVANSKSENYIQFNPYEELEHLKAMFEKQPDFN